MTNLTELPDKLNRLLKRKDETLAEWEQECLLKVRNQQEYRPFVMDVNIQGKARYKVFYLDSYEHCLVDITRTVAKICEYRMNNAKSAIIMPFGGVRHNFDILYNLAKILDLDDALETASKWDSNYIIR